MLNGGLHPIGEDWSVRDEDPRAQGSRLPRPTQLSERAAGLPATPKRPPAEVLEALDRAAYSLGELAAMDVTLHLEVDDLTKRVRVQILDWERRIVREVPPSRLFEILSGDSGVRLALDILG